MRWHVTRLPGALVDILLVIVIRNLILGLNHTWRFQITLGNWAEGKYRVSNSWGLDNVSRRFFLRYLRFLTSLVRVFLFIWFFFISSFFTTFNILKQCSIRVNVMARYTVSTAGTNGSSKHYHVMGISLPGSCNLPVFNFFPFGLFDWFSKAIETTRNQSVKTTLAYVKPHPSPR